MKPLDAALFTQNIEEKADAVVVGSGAGGAVIAKELAEGGMKVILLEEGGHHLHHRDLAFEAIRRLYRDHGFTSTLGSPIIPVPMGKCFGGTTVVNSGTCFRLPRSVLEKWRNVFGLTNLDPQILDLAFEKVEKEIHVEPADFSVMSRTNTLMHELLSREGFKGAAIHRNIRHCEGCGMCCYGCTSGAKQSMDVSYLPKALGAGAIAYTHARATQILQDSRGAQGILAEAIDSHSQKTGITLKIKADRTIIAAGTFLTPQLLKLNGIARENKHLGKHLTLHPATKLFAEFDEEIRGWDGTPQAYYLDSFQDEGIMFEGIFTPPDLLGMSVPFIGKKLTHFIKHYSHITSFGFLIKDESEGKLVRLPFLGYRYCYSLTPGDIRRIQQGVAFLARIFLKGGARKVYPLIRTQMPELTTLEEVNRFEKSQIRSGDVDCMAFHPLGTCRMATHPKNGVCDQNHEVFGMSRLYLCDGSIMPSSLGVNPQLTIMAMATRLAGQLLSETRN